LASQQSFEEERNEDGFPEDEEKLDSRQSEEKEQTSEGSSFHNIVSESIASKNESSAHESTRSQVGAQSIESRSNQQKQNRANDRYLDTTDSHPNRVPPQAPVTKTPQGGRSVSSPATFASSSQDYNQPLFINTGKDMIDSSHQSCSFPPSKANSIKSLGDLTGDGSNDTTVHVTKENFEQPQYGTSLNSNNQSRNGSVSLSRLDSRNIRDNDSPSFDYSRSQSQSQYHHQPQQQQQLLPESQQRRTMKLNKSELPRDDSDNNTITEFVEKNLESIGRSRSGSRSILKRDDSSKRSNASPSPHERLFFDPPQPHPDQQYDNRQEESEQPQESQYHHPSAHASSFPVTARQPSGISNYDDSTYRSEMSTDQDSRPESNMEEDEETRFNRLKYGTTLKKTQSAVSTTSSYYPGGGGNRPVTTKASLQPASKSLQMGKHKLNATKPLATASATKQAQLGNKTIDDSGGKNKLVGKTVNERLFYNAELMKKKKDILSQKAENQKYEKFQNEKFKLNETSRQIVETIHNRGCENGSVGSNMSDIGQKLYYEGINNLENKKKKYEKIEKMKEENHLLLENWSCVKCGTFHKIPSHLLASTTPLMWGLSANTKFICSVCDFNNKETVTSFKPTNVGLLYNESTKENIEGKRIENSLNPSSIHEYLYQQGKQQDQILSLNRALWEEQQEKTSFKPMIPERSKAIIRSYKHNQNGEGGEGMLHKGGEFFEEALLGGEFRFPSASHDDHHSIASSSLQEGGNNGRLHHNAKIAGENMKEYFSKSTFERLQSTQIRSYYEEAAMFGNPTKLSVKPATFASSPSLGQKSITSTLDGEGIGEGEGVGGEGEKKERHHQDQFVNRLVYEYKEKENRQQKRENSYYGQLFHPKISTLPEEIMAGKRIDSKRKDIWEDIIRRDKDMIKEKLKKQQLAIEKTLNEINKSQVKALPSSNEILQSSTQKNLEDLYKLLLVSTHPLNEELPIRDIPSEETGEEGTMNGDLNTLDISHENETEMTGGSTSVKNQPSEEFREEFSFSKRVLPSARNRNQYDRTGDDESSKLRMDFLNEEASHSNSILGAVIEGDNNTIVSEKQLNEVLTNHLKDWKEKKLDVLLIKPELLINEISTLLLDMRHVLFERWHEKQQQRLKEKEEKKEKDTSSNSKDNQQEEEGDDVMKTAPDSLFLSFNDFCRLAIKCTKHRCGPGKGYIFAPKKKAELAIQMKLADYSQETFHPLIDKTSEAIIQKHRVKAMNEEGSISVPPIEDILREDGKRVEKKIELLRQEKKEKEEKELTFKPFLYKTPSYIIPRYRGLDLSGVGDEDEDGDMNKLEETHVLSHGSSYHQMKDDSLLFSPDLSISQQQQSKQQMQPGRMTAKTLLQNIPNVTITNKSQQQQQGNVKQQSTAIRGGGSNSSKNSSVTASNSGGGLISSQIKPVGISPKSGQKNSSAGGMPGSPSKPLLVSTLSVDTISSPKNQGAHLLTPPDVRHSRLLNHQADLPPMPPIPTSSTAANFSSTSSDTMNNTRNYLSNQRIASSSGSFDADDGRHQPKDDVSIFSLTESAMSIPVEHPSLRDKVKSGGETRGIPRDRSLSTELPPGNKSSSSNASGSSGAKLSSLAYTQSQQRSSHQSSNVHRVDSSSRDSEDHLMSVSASSNNSLHSLDFPSRFSAVSDISHSHAYNSNTEADDDEHDIPVRNSNSYQHLHQQQLQQQHYRPEQKMQPVVAENIRKPMQLHQTNSNYSMDTAQSSITGYTAGKGSSVHSQSSTSLKGQREGGSGLIKGVVKRQNSSQKLTTPGPGSSKEKGKTVGKVGQVGYFSNYVQKALPLLPHEVNRQPPYSSNGKFLLF
jgi:hypothetical protein